MSSDQRPTRAKVVDGGTLTPQPVPSAASGAAAAAGAADSPPPAGSPVLPALVFLLGAAAGGAGLVWFLRTAV